MKKILFITNLMLLFAIISIKAQLTPQDAARGMMRGINIGNTMEPPTEGSWDNPPVKERAFDDYKNAGFTAIRIPITWAQHIATTSPYAINAAWLDRVEEVIDWGLARKLYIIINAHHEFWIRYNYTADNIARFDSLWSQIATRFRDKSDSLLFEMINEPNPMSLQDVNELNARTLATIRKTNPTRIVLFSGNVYSNSAELIQATVPDDDYLMGYYHSYDPYPFGLQGPGTYGSESDIAQTAAKFDQVTAWATTHTLPVILGEYGYMKDCEYNSRMCAHATAVDQALRHGIPPFAWDDGGDFPIYNRTTYEFNEIKDILIYTYPQSPNRILINNYADTLVKISWKNRTTENDTIIIERSIGNAGSLVQYAKISPLDSSYIDSNAVRAQTYYYRLTTTLDDTVKIQSYPVRIVNIPVTPQPYSGTAIQIPGSLEVENFDLGIEGVTYHDSDPINQGDMYRPGVGADIYKKGSTYYLYNVEEGEWLDYTVNVAEEDDYNITAYVGADTTGGEFTMQAINETSLPFIVSISEGLTLFKKISNTIHLLAGVQKLRINITKTPSFTLNKLTFSIATSVNEKSSDMISVYPNPASDQVIIKGIVNPSTINIYDISGTLMKTVMTNSYETDIPIDMMEDGLYILKCADLHNSFCIKLIKKNN
jgi:hypothetical protein